MALAIYRATRLIVKKWRRSSDRRRLVWMFRVSLPFPLRGPHSRATNVFFSAEPEVVSDYVDPTTIKIKKPRKKKTKSTRKRPADDDDLLNPEASAQPNPPTEDSPDGEAMEVSSSSVIPTPPKRKIAEDMSFVDDDDLQSSLALQRRSALKKRKILKPADIARQLREESAAGESGPATPSMDVDDDEGEAPGLIIDQTSEFVATLRAPTTDQRKLRHPLSEQEQQDSPGVRIREEDDDEEEHQEDEDGDGDVNMVRDERSPSVKRASESTTSAPPAITSTGLDEETVISRGVGATLAMLNQRGLLRRDPEAEKKLSLQRDRDRFRLDKRRRELEAEEKAKAARAKDRQSGKFERMSAREREEHARWENKQRDLQEARETAQKFKDYKPDINLSYKDEFGREMNQKEASFYDMSTGDDC
jgi:U4/U6.U5 tri-snRNP-associated protein 1